MRIGSLFSGAAGLDRAVEAVFGGRTVWHSEIDPAASKVLAYRYPDTPNLGDITKVDWTQVEPVDILCGGWPCQPWSAAGKQKGTADERALWPHVAAAVGVLRPRYVCLENVPGIVVLGELARAVGDLCAVGYDAQWATVSAASVGAPHRRERVFILASARGVDSGAYPFDAGIRVGGRVIRGRGIHQFSAESVQEDPHARASDDRSGRGAAVRRHDWSRPDQGTVCTEGDRHEADLAVDDIRERRCREGAEPSVAGTGESSPCPCCGGDDAAEAGEPGHAGSAIVATDAGGDGRGGGAQRHLEQAGGIAAPFRDDTDRRAVADGRENGCDATDASGVGRDEGRPEPARLVGGFDAALGGDGLVNLLPTPCARDFKDGEFPATHARDTPSLGAVSFYLPTPRTSDTNGAGLHGDGGPDLRTAITELAKENNRAATAGLHRGPHTGSSWGRYEAAIRRWEAVLGRTAPSPTEPNRNGNPRLNPEFSSWLMGWPAGWVTEVPGISRNDQLRIIGNGVVDRCAEAALRWLLSVSEAAA